MATNTLLRILPRAGVLRAILAMWLRMAGLCLSVAFGRLFGGMLEVQYEGVPGGLRLGEGRFSDHMTHTAGK